MSVRRLPTLRRAFPRAIFGRLAAILKRFRAPKANVFHGRICGTWIAQCPEQTVIA
jgi:hypothetical protein